MEFEGKTVQVYILVGTGIVDLRETFVPSMPIQSRSTLRAGAVRIAADSGVWLSAARGGGLALPAVRRYVIGVGARPDDGSATSPAGSETTSRPRCASAIRHALQVGWLLGPTVADGDCGIDCMSWHVTLPCTLDIRIDIKAGLADFIERVAEDEAWQDVFDACCEMAPFVADPLSNGSGPAASSSSASSGLGGPPPSPP
jgi:hypothetical protein